jgi:hypothetical protein
MRTSSNVEVEARENNGSDIDAARHLNSLTKVALQS